MKGKLKNYLVNKDLLAHISLMSVVVLALWPYFNPRLMSTNDEALGFYYPLSFFYHESVNAGTSATWIGGYYGGMSAPFQQFITIFSPFSHLLYSWFSFSVAHHLAIVVPTLAGVIAAYWLARSFSLSREATIITAFSYLLAFSFDWLNIGPIVAYSFLLYPLLLLCLLKISERKHPWFFFLFGTLTIGMGFIAGFTQYIFYFFLVSLLFALFLDVTKSLGRATTKAPFFRPQHFFTTITLGVMVIGGALIGIRQLMVSFLLVGDSIRSLAYPVETAGIFDIIKLYTLLFPPYISFPGASTGAQGLYLGGAALCLVLIALIIRRAWVHSFFAITVIILLGFAFHLPPFSYINDHVPPLSNFRYIMRYLMAASLPLALLAGFGFDKIILANGKERGHIRTFLKWHLAVSILITAGVFALGSLLQIARSAPAFQEKLITLYFWGRHMPDSLVSYQEKFIRMTDRIADTYTLTNVWLVVPLLFLILAPILVWLFIDKRITRQQFSLLMPLLVACNLIFVFSYNHSQFLPTSLLLQEPALASAMKSREENRHTYRVMDYLVDEVLNQNKILLGVAPETQANIEQALMRRSSNVLFGIDKMNGFGIFRTVRQNQIIDTILNPGQLYTFDPIAFSARNQPLNRWANTHVLQKSSLTEKQKAEHLHLPLRSMMNVKYIYSLLPLEHPNLTTLTYENNLPFPVYLYENTSVLPRVYFANTVQFVKPNSESVLDTLLSIENFSDMTIIECATCPPPTPNRSSTLNITHYEDGFISINATSSGQWLIVSESHAPGWQATVDGYEVPIQVANYLFQAIYVPPGTHSIELVHTDIGKRTFDKLRDIIFFGA